MTQQPSPLAYYRASATEMSTRRPTSVTVVAVIGIVVTSLLIISQQFNLAVAWRWGGGGGSSPSSRMESPVALGMAAGLVVRNLFTLLLLIGCCGVLALRQVGRRAALIAAYGWIVFGVIEVWFLIQNAYLSKALTGRPAPVAGMAITGLLIVVIEIGYPAAAILVLRPRRVYELFARQPARRAVMPRLFKPVAIAVIAAASIWALDGVIALTQIAGDRTRYRGGYVTTPRLLQMPGGPGYYEVGTPEGRDFMIVDGLLWTVLNAAWVTGGVLVLNRRREGVWIVIACSLARLAFAIGMGGREMSVFMSPGSGGLAVDFWATFNVFVRLLAARVNTLLVPALLLVVFTHRPAEPMPPALPPQPPRPGPRVGRPPQSPRPA
jgi:hypothetical protein